MSSTGGKYLKRLSSFDALSKGGASGRDSNFVGETVMEACILARTEFKLQVGFAMAMRSKSWIITLCVDQFAVVTLYTSLNCKNPHWGRDWCEMWLSLCTKRRLSLASSGVCVDCGNNDEVDLDGEKHVTSGDFQRVV